MRINKWLFYSIYAIIITSYIIFSINVTVYFAKQSIITASNLTALFVLPILFIFLGVLLGLEHLVFEIIKVGKWRINLPKIIFLGIPALYFALGNYIYTYCPVKFILNTVFAPFKFIMLNEQYYVFATILQVVFGYIIISSFIKIKD